MTWRLKNKDELDKFKKELEDKKYIDDQDSKLHSIFFSIKRNDGFDDRYQINYSVPFNITIQYTNTHNTTLNGFVPKSAAEETKNIIDDIVKKITKGVC